MSTFNKHLLVWGLLLSLFACKEPFIPEVSPKQYDLLVVEGFINMNREGVTTIKLSRTLNLTDPAKPKYEEGASLSIETSEGVAYKLAEQKPGLYETAPLSLAIHQQYRLRIKTKSGDTYLSAFVTPYITPEIDQVTWQWEGDGVSFAVQAQGDPSAKTFYMWDYIEDWEIHSTFETEFDWINNKAVRRSEKEKAEFFYCWRNAPSSDYFLISSGILREGKVRQKLFKIPSTSDKISVKYSLLVQQHSLPKEAFEYMNLMKKNTTELGSFFDAQPSELPLSNMINLTSTGQPVIGYLWASSKATKRVYIKREEVPSWDFDMGCSEMDLLSHPALINWHTEGDWGTAYVITRILAGNNLVLTSRTCADCKVRGGNPMKPAFWD